MCFLVTICGIEKCEEIKGVIRSRKSIKTAHDNRMVKRKRIKGKTMIYKTLHRKLKIEQH